MKTHSLGTGGEGERQKWSPLPLFLEVKLQILQDSCGFDPKKHCWISNECGLLWQCGMTYNTAYAAFTHFCKTTCLGDSW